MGLFGATSLGVGAIVGGGILALVALWAILSSVYRVDVDGVG